jgi:hypothetical protein
MVFLSNMPAYLGLKGEGAVKRFSIRKFFETGDANWIHWVAIARSFMRGMTAMGQLEGIEADKFILGGCSKRGQATWIAAAADRRVAGIFPVARPGNFPHFVQCRLHGLSPRSGSAETQWWWEQIYSQRGYEAPAMCMVGTNDEHYEPFTDHGFYPFIEGDKNFCYVANYRHGIGTEVHAKAFRFWTAHCFWGRPVTRLTALADIAASRLRVEAIVRSKAEVTGVNVQFCVLQGAGFSDDRERFRAVPAERVGQTDLWRADILLGDDAGKEVYWYVEAIDWADGLEGFASTLMARIPAIGYDPV